MEKSIKFLFLTILFISSSLIPIHLHSAENVKIQRVLDTGKVNMCILQGKDGLLWFGTEGEGLFCYDGNELKKIKVTKNENSFLMIWSAFVDKEARKNDPTGEYLLINECYRIPLDVQVDYSMVVGISSLELMTMALKEVYGLKKKRNFCGLGK